MESERGISSRTGEEDDGRENSSERTHEELKDQTRKEGRKRRDQLISFRQRRRELREAGVDGKKAYENPSFVADPISILSVFQSEIVQAKGQGSLAIERSKFWMKSEISFIEGGRRERGSSPASTKLTHCAMLTDPVSSQRPRKAWLREIWAR